MAPHSSPEGSALVPAEPDGLVRLRRALLSVSDRRGVVELGRALSAQDVELVATGSTRTALAAGAVASRAAEELTGIGAWFGGRVKTLHPGILGGILAPRTPDGERELAERHLLPIDLVVVNFYPFAERVGGRPDAPELAELIDIGGVTLARAAAKNFDAVAVASDPDDYPLVEAEVGAWGGRLSAPTRRALAARAFARTEAYDRTIAATLAGPAGGSAPGPFPPALALRRADLALRYGENPHQPAAVYVAEGEGSSALAPAPVELLKGTALSYTNLLDLDAAVGTVAEFDAPAAAVVKHATPSGAATAPTLREAVARAVATDPVARYGCAIAVNRPLGAADLAPLHGIFVDLLAAPSVDDAARAAADRRPKLKLVRIAVPDRRRPAWEARSALGRLLVQVADQRELKAEELRCVTSRAASEEQLRSLAFAWRVVRHAKSNAIVLARGTETVGVGSGQPTRVKAVQLAAEVAGERARGSVLASDAFFPFADGLEAAAAAGVVAVLQPGGSLRDADVVGAAERHGIAMYLTGWRVFRH